MHPNQFTTDELIVAVQQTLEETGWLYWHLQVAGVESRAC
jgi:hypothetical protein